MVGSGVSKFAWNARPHTDAPSMLSDVAIEIHRRLYPQSGTGDRDSKTTLADRILSLAQEYETAFERASLHQLLQQLIRDDDLKPGETHARLLQLPWRDVFTTNWDTLLERARPHSVSRAYSIVRDMDEIPLANKPRTVSETDPDTRDTLTYLITESNGDGHFAIDSTSGRDHCGGEPGLCQLRPVPRMPA